ncbi:cysteine hydrolase family protein [Streptomyces yaizuensis]|uniref:Cysteine hydrolase n=1 Tax=Streptomyces yaizuensis TaxID=2989713 RepID=A0ABQ5PAK3_9ACTN|nr:cysteine hydrolase family protein [Streptomyces sp. YSPA8]GLF99614.1 cysteine hydrolase [Streptomyces sp. YSPA8]
MTGPIRTALLVVDVQNDFCTGPRAEARFGTDPAALHSAVAGTVRAVARARRRGVEPVFVRFVGDPEYQGASWSSRDARRGSAPKCLEGTRGAEFHGVAPAPGEAVVTKKAVFDAFLGTDLEELLRRRGVGHLVLTGLFTDVCVDSTARTAFQKGFHLTVLRDCTTALYLPTDDMLGFMSTLYGARVTTADDPAAWDAPPYAGGAGEPVPSGEGQRE